MKATIIMRLTVKYMNQGYTIVKARIKAVQHYNFLLECGKLDTRTNTTIRGL